MAFKRIARSTTEAAKPKAGSTRTSPLAGVHAKLKVGAVNDPLEREADAMADAFMRGESARATQHAGGGNTVQRKCDACEEEEGVMRKEAGAGAVRGNAEAAVGRARAIPGVAMSLAMQSQARANYNFSFEQVRVHTDGAAQAAAQSLGARAFTAGRDIFFGAGEYAPETPRGKRLIAHELAHVVQGGDRDVLRRTPLEDEAMETVAGGKRVDEGFRAMDDIAKDLVSTLKHRSNPKPFFDAVLRTPFRMGLTAVFFERDVADAFIEAVPLSLLKQKRTERDAARALRLMGGKVSPKVRSRPAVEEKLKAIFGGITAGSKQAIVEQNFASGEDEDGNDFPNYCMHAVLGVVESVCGPGSAQEVQELAGSNRKAAAAAAKTPKAKKRAKKILNSQNLNAAVELGKARWLGESKFDKQICRDIIQHDDDGSTDPFSLGDASRRNVLLPDPEAVMLKAVGRGPVGTYVFPTSVAGHHSVTIILEKHKAGSVGVGSGNYTLWWNDQFSDDGLSGVDAGVRTGTTLGRRLAHRELESRVFFNTLTRHSDPSRRSFWAKATDHANFLKSEAGKASRSEKASARRKALNQRCSNAVGMKIWQLFPQ